MYLVNNNNIIRSLLHNSLWSVLGLVSSVRYFVNAGIVVCIDSTYGQGIYYPLSTLYFVAFCESCSCT